MCESGGLNLKQPVNCVLSLAALHRGGQRSFKLKVNLPNLTHTHTHTHIYMTVFPGLRYIFTPAMASSSNVARGSNGTRSGWL